MIAASENTADGKNQEIAFSAMKYSDFRVIIADEQHTFASLMKGILLSLGFSKITVASSGDEAQKICAHAQFDIYLFDCSFRNGISGLELVQHLRKNHLAPCMALMFIITGDHSRSKVLCAVEQEPDDYIVKPFSQKQFARRLKKALAKKKDLEDIYSCIYRNDAPGAISALEKAVSAGTPYDVYCRCLLSDYYISTGQHNLAQAVIQEGMACSESDYLKFALGKVLYSRKLHEESLSVIQDVLTRRPLMTDAIEYVSKNYLSLGMPEKAIQSIRQAVALSPLSEKLLNTQITTALNAGDFMTARDGLALLLNVKKNSPEEVDTLLESFVQCEFMFVENSHDPFHISNMEKVIGNIIGRYQACTSKDRFSMETFKTVCEARVALIRGETQRSKRRLYQALTAMNEDNRNIADSIKIGMYLGLLSLGEYEVAEHLSQELAGRSAASDIAMNILDICVSRKNAEQAERRNKYQELNSQGIKEYKNGKLDEALRLFKEAKRKVPGNSNAILNKIQILLDMSEIQLKQDPRNGKDAARGLIQECASDLRLLEGIPLSKVQAERTELLKKDFAEIQSKTAKR